jgi:uncharacterized glyoxalase superfamily protein PhnB
MSKSHPSDWPQISASLFYAKPAEAIDWLCRAYGFEVRLKVDGENGDVVHSELVFGDGLIMVSGNGKGHPRVSPRDVGGANTQCLFAYVPDVEAHCARARAAGAKIVIEPKTTDYGEDYWADRSYEAEDPEGHRWWFAQRMRSKA